MGRFAIYTVLSLVIATSTSFAASVPESWRLMAIMGNRAIVQIDNKSLTLHLNRPHAKGYTLTALSTDTATIEYQQQSYQLQQGQKGIRTDYKPQATQEYRVTRDPSGMYRTYALINSVSVPVLMDTGATGVVLNRNQARQLGIDYLNKPKITIVTASGYTYGYSIELKSVRVGTIEVRHVDGVVMDSNQPAQALIGMSFLSRLQVTHDKNVLVLTQSY